MAVGANFYNGGNAAITESGQAMADAYGALMGTDTGDIVGLSLNSAAYGFTTGAFKQIDKGVTKAVETVDSIARG